MSLTANGLPVESMRWFAPWSGVWTAELVFGGDAMPFGPVVIASETGIALTGAMVLESSTFGERRRATVVGGRAGWQKRVRAQHYNSSVGVPFATIASTTAAEVGEVVTVLAPFVVGTDFARRSDLPASQIFEGAGVDWWVGVDGVTRVGVRPPAAPPASLEILDWDHATGTASFTCDVLVEPGTVIADDRFRAPRVVREVDCQIAEGSVHGTLRLVEQAPSAGATSELVDEIVTLARAGLRADFARVYEYRVIAMAGDRVELQAVSRGAPDILPASVWAGASGYRATLRPSSRVLVGFVDGDPRRPYLAAYEPPEGDGWRPVKLELDALAIVQIGEQAPAVVLGSALGAFPIARLTPSFATWIGAVSAFVNGMAPGSVVPPADVASTKVVSS